MLLVTGLRGSIGARDLVAALDRRQAVVPHEGDGTAYAGSLAGPGSRLVRCTAATAATMLLDVLTHEPPRPGEPVVLLEMDEAAGAALAIRLAADQPEVPALARLRIADPAHHRAADVVDAGCLVGVGPLLADCGPRAGSDLLAIVSAPPLAAALALTGLAQLVLAVHGRRVPATPDWPETASSMAAAIDADPACDRPLWSRYWPPALTGPRTGLALLPGGTVVVVTEAPLRQPDGICGADVAPHAFAVTARDAAGLASALLHEASPAAWPGPAGEPPCRATLVVQDAAALPRVAITLRDRIDGPSAHWTDLASGSSFVLEPIGPAPVAFVFSGFGTGHPGMLRRLTDALPGLADYLEAAFGPALRRAMPARTMYPRRATKPLAAQQLRGTGTEIAASEFLGHATYSWIALEMLGLRPAAAIGISLGGLAMLPVLCGQPAWMTSLATDPGGLIDLSAQLAENAAQGESEDWTHWWVGGPGDEIAAALKDAPSVHLLVRCDDRLVLLGGPAKVIAALTKAHRFLGRRTSSGMRHLHTPMIMPAVARLKDGLTARYRSVDRERLRGIDVYVSDRPVRPGASTAALQHLLEQTSASLCLPVDVPAMTRAAYRRGVRVFVGVGCRHDTIGWIGRCLEGLPHLAVPLGTTRLDPWGSLLSAVRLLRTHGVLPPDTPFDQVMRTPA